MAMPVEVLGPDERAYPSVIKTLLLDDNTFDRARLRRMSRKTNLMVELVEVCDIKGMKAAVAREVFDLILIDYRLPQGDGLDVLAHIQASALNKDAATIMITGEGDMETAVTAMRNGCHDFLAKDAMTAEQLRFSMVGAIRSAAQQRDLAAQSARQQDMIRQGLTAALMDRDLQGSVVLLFREEMRRVLGQGPFRLAVHDPAELDAVLAALSEDDEFVFR
jgi:DNA-binding NtrC family response regulator